MKYLLLLITILCLGACQVPSCEQESACNEFSPPAKNQITCQMYVKGYYYNSSTNQCTYYEGSACNQPPFQKRADCIPCECK